MKKQALSIVAVLSLVIAIAVTGLANLSGRITVNVPFDFNVGGKLLPAGTYYVLNDNMARGSVAVVNKTTGHSMGFFVQPSQIKRSETGARLIFHRYGNQSFLANIWDGQSASAAQVLKSKAEREAARSAGKYLASGVAQPEVIAIAAQ